VTTYDPPPGEPVTALSGDRELEVEGGPNRPRCQGRAAGPAVRRSSVPRRRVRTRRRGSSRGTPTPRAR
jgi:hypothetical protein